MQKLNLISRKYLGNRRWRNCAGGRLCERSEAIQWPDAIPRKATGLLRLRLAKMAALFFILSPCLYALPTDHLQLAQLDADRVDFNVQTHAGLYQGQVHFTQGSSHLEAEEAQTKFDQNNQLIYAIALTKPPARAHFWTQPHPEDQEVHGYAQSIEYFPKKNLIVLKGDAQIIQGKNNLSSPIMHFDLNSHHLITQSSGKTRTHIEIQQDKSP